jgi:flagellar L-ring protein precursor FlgH
MSARFAHLVIAVLVSGCHNGPVAALRDPVLSPIGTGVVPPPQTTAIGQSLAQKRTEPRDHSLWTEESVDLFRDPRAARVGDVITVRIAIKDRATLDNTSNRSRESKFEIKPQLQYGLSSSGAAPVSGEAALNAGVDSQSSSSGRGAITRSEMIEFLVAATVTNTLPNGNLVISGVQEVQVNHEIRELHVAGIVRARDIATDNSISYERIAEARISYGGRGRVTEVQQPGWLHRLVDALTPF